MNHENIFQIRTRSWTNDQRAEITKPILESTFSQTVLQAAGKPDCHQWKTCHKEPRGKTAQRNGDYE